MNQKLWVIGHNEHYQFGLKHKDDLKDLTDWTSKNTNIKPKAIYMMYRTMIIEDYDGKYWAMGYNKYGECGVKSKDEYITTPQQMEVLNNMKIKRIFINLNDSDTIFVITENGTVFGFGDNRKGQLGIKGKKVSKPTQMHSLKRNIIKIIPGNLGGFLPSLALDSDGKVWTTKHKYYNKMDNKDDTHGFEPIKSLNKANIIDIGCGYHHSIFIDSNGTMYAVGKNEYGQFGNGTTNNSDGIITVEYFKINKINITKIECGCYHNLALDKKYNVYSWGRNVYGQCGDGTHKDLSYPKLIPLLKKKKIVDIKCGRFHSYVKSVKSAVYKHFMFGYNGHNECTLSQSQQKKINNPYCINEYGYIKECYLGYSNTTVLVSYDDKKTEGAEAPTKVSNVTNKQTKEVKYDDKMVQQLMSVVSNPSDINAVVDKLKQIQNEQFGSYSYSTDDLDEKVSEINSNTTSLNVFEDQISSLLNVVKTHITFMTQQEKSVNTIIEGSSAQRDKLKDAKNKALETERNTLNDIMEISKMNTFLNNIILIENLFNNEYTKEQKQRQESARYKYAKNMKEYETKAKPICNTKSFVDLLFGAYSDLGSFKDFVKNVEKECDKAKIKIHSSSGASQKNIERAFYKAFYVYSLHHGTKGHQQLTDVLRCSLVFDTFDDIYHCFEIIERLSAANGGILRCKDRFNVALNKMPFGYRDLLVNVNCPRSQVPIVCEMQLHHTMFYQHKTVSHSMYKKARLFEDAKGENMAYKYADKHTRPIVGNERYDYGDEKEEVVDPKHMLKQWNLLQYASVLVDDEGYDDVLFWKYISEEDLVGMGFKKGHAMKFAKLANDL